jgi:ribosomal subunit interface protein
MEVRFTGRHVGIQDSDREYVQVKVSALARFHRHLQDVEVRVMMDGTEVERVELEADLGHHRVVARADAAGFRPAFDEAVETLKRALLKDKEKVVGVRRRASRRSSARGGPR